MPPATEVTERAPKPTPRSGGRAPGGSRSRTVPWAVVALWVVALALAAPFAGKLMDVTRDKPTDYLPGGADSTRVQHLVEKLPGGNTSALLLVHHRDGGLTAADRELARGQVRQIAGTYSLAGEKDGALPRTVPAKDGETLLTAFSLTGMGDEDVRDEAVHRIRDEIAGQPRGLTVELGGPGAMAADSSEIFESVDGTLMLGTAVVVALLLILTYRSPVLWLVPLLVVGVAALAARALVYGLVQAFDLTATTMNTSVMTVLIFGAGTDYALLLVSRYREELRAHQRPFDAMTAALRGCGPAVLASSGTVAAGLLCLLAADLNSVNALGPVGAVGVVCALVAMTTLLPALLVLLGRRLFWPLIPAYGSAAPARRTLFTAMGGSAGRRPVTVLVGGALLLGALCLGTLALPGDLREQDTFTEKPESVSAQETVQKAFPDSSSRPVTVLARATAAPDVERAVRGTDGVVRVEKGRSGGGWTEFSAFAKDRPESEGELDTIRRLRGELTGLDGAEALVGGPSAQQLDLRETNADDRKVVIPLVLAAVLVILIALLRSLVAPLILTAAVVATWGAALGLGGLAFEPVLGFEGLDAGIPLMTFVFLVALGVDYGIFLMHRTREESLRGVPVAAASLIALRTTGGVIASAGIVLAATFCVLATLPMVLMAELGLVIAVGVLLDTFLVRTYLVTSAAQLLKRWMWWPGRLFRAEGEAGSAAGSARGE
ncbi:MMPL family transporter [Streptomyces spirodelae]|uniref:MMPL family transporter n=1 Tax=Streptomyces spirodelae TaxID=2812904 RepID=A0ABS3WMP4_9ACTN|nr:MMPL family transporter [Streptomyces spirodelae]MBO8184394.1 MMPL family transporter [Streptomyces spirodelae]